LEKLLVSDLAREGKRIPAVRASSKKRFTEAYEKGCLDKNF